MKTLNAFAALVILGACVLANAESYGDPFVKIDIAKAAIKTWMPNPVLTSITAKPIFQPVISEGCSHTAWEYHFTDKGGRGQRDLEAKVTLEEENSSYQVDSKGQVVYDCRTTSEFNITDRPTPHLKALDLTKTFVSLDAAAATAKENGLTEITSVKIVTFFYYMNDHDVYFFLGKNAAGEEASAYINFTTGKVEEL